MRLFQHQGQRNTHWYRSACAYFYFYFFLDKIFIKITLSSKKKKKVSSLIGCFKGRLRHFELLCVDLKVFKNMKQTNKTGNESEKRAFLLLIVLNQVRFEQKSSFMSRKTPVSIQVSITANSPLLPLSFSGAPF